MPGLVGGAGVWHTGAMQDAGSSEQTELLLAMEVQSITAVPVTVPSISPSLCNMLPVEE